MVADVLHNFDLLLSVMLPIVDIVNRALFLQTLQKRLVFTCDPLRLEVPGIGVERFGNGAAFAPPAAQLAH